LKYIAVLLLALACSFSSFAQVQVLQGSVTNGTSDKPAAGDAVILLKLGQGMEEVSRTKTDAKGKFSFNMARVTGIFLVRVRHQDVNYHQPLQPGASSVQITVYDSKVIVPEIKLQDESEVYETQANTVQIVKVFRLNNASSPKFTQPQFEFYLPEGANIRVAQAVAGGPAVKVTVVPMQEKNRYALSYPVRPGETHFEVVYQMPYSGALKIAPKMAMVPEKFYVVTPKSIKFAADNSASFQNATSWPIDTTIKDIDIHEASPSSAGAQLAFALSGTGMLPDDQPPANPGANQTPAEAVRPGGGMGVPNEKPDPLHSAQWLLLGILVVCLGTGAAFIYFQNQPSAAPAGAGASVAKSSGSLMDHMKEEMFQLESDRLQGKLSPEEYQEAKSALDQTLKRAMQRQEKSK
jgi:hypothetical protein